MSDARWLDVEDDVEVASAHFRNARALHETGRRIQIRCSNSEAASRLEATFARDLALFRGAVDPESG